MIASETRNHCAAVVMDLSTRANSGGGDSSDSGSGRRRSGGGGSRPAKSVFSIRSLVGEDTAAVQRDRDEDGGSGGDDDGRTHHRHRRHRRDDEDVNDDEDDGESVRYYNRNVIWTLPE